MNVWQQNSHLGGLPFIKDARSLHESSWNRTRGTRDLYFIERVSLHECTREIMVWYSCWLYGFVDWFVRLFKISREEKIL